VDGRAVLREALECAPPIADALLAEGFSGAIDA
jgi:hypothetical protein